MPTSLPYELEEIFGARGAAPMRLLMPSSVVALVGRNKQHMLAVAETGSHRISVLSTSGHFHRTIEAPLNAVAHSSRPLRYPMGLAMADEDSIVVADTHNHRLIRLSIVDGRPLANATSGRLHFGAALTPFRYPKGLAAYSKHEWPPHGPLSIAYVADSGNHRVCALALGPTAAGASIPLPGPISSASAATMVPLLCFGQAGTGDADMDRPSAVAVAPMRDGLRLFVADTFHDRVQEVKRADSNLAQLPAFEPATCK